jgi:chemotaxis protein methyltransferase CheR
VLDAKVRESARFEQLNLNAEAPDFWQPGAFDLVFARNVLMYFAPSPLRAAVARISRSLAPDGYFFFGHSESMRELSDDFDLRHTHDTFYYRRKHDTGVTTEPRDNTPWFEQIGKASERVRGLTSAPRSAASVHAPTAQRMAQDPLTEALSLFGQERFAESMKVLDAGGAAAQRSTDSLLLRAMLLVQDGKLQEAEDTAHAALTRDSHCAAAHYVIALCRESIGDLAAAANRYGQAASLDPGFALPHLHLGLLARRRGDHKQRKQELSRAMALLETESPQRLLMFGGGFDRAALLNLCRAELRADGVLT